MNTDQGELKFAWSNANPLSPVTLADGESMFDLCFDVVGNPGDVSPIYFASEGSLIVEFWNEGFEPLDVLLIEGNVVISTMGCPLDEADISYPLDTLQLSEFNLDPQQLSPQQLIDDYGYDESEVLITTPDTVCLVVAQTYTDQVFDFGDGSFKILREIILIDWISYDANTEEGVYTFTQTIFAGIDPASLICDFLPRTAAVGDCESGHTLDDDVEWPADLSIADHRISPEELVEFSMVDVLDSEPSFYNEPDDYESNYSDLLVELTPTTLTLDREWVVNHVTYEFSWTYTQSIVIDISDFENLVTVNTGSNRAMPGVVINEDFTTNMQGVAYVENEPVNTVQYEDAYLNGVNVMDLILIMRHILGLNLLTESGVLAADANQNSQITAADLILLRNRMLGIEMIESGDWLFYDKEGAIAVETKGILQAVKLGDVDDSVLLQGEDAQEPQNKLLADDILLNNGESYSVPVYMKEGEFDALGIELRIQLDLNKLNVIEVVSSYDVEENAFDYHITEEGLLTVMFTSPVEGYLITNGASNPLFTVNFEAKENTLLSLSMDLEHSASYIATSDLELIVLNGGIEDMIGTGTNSPELEHLSVYPNPTSDYLFLDMTRIDVSGALEVTIFGLDGQKMLVTRESTIDVSNLISGMYYYQVKLDNFIKTGKFIIH